MRTHSNADNRKLGDTVLGLDAGSANFPDHRLQRRGCLGEFVLGKGEGNIGGPLGPRALDDHVDHHVCRGEGGEDACGGAGLVRNMTDGDLRLILFDAHPAHHDGFHALGFFFHNGSWVMVETGAHLKDDSELFGKLHGTALHDLGAARGHLQHFVVGDLVDFGGVLHHARVARVDAVDVGENLAEVRLDGGSDGDRRQIRAAAAEGGDAAVGRLALKPGDDDDVAAAQRLKDAFW
jgi:hypothetical protein